MFPRLRSSVECLRCHLPQPVAAEIRASPWPTVSQVAEALRKNHDPIVIQLAQVPPPKQKKVSLCSSLDCESAAAIHCDHPCCNYLCPKHDMELHSSMSDEVHNSLPVAEYHQRQEANRKQLASERLVKRLQPIAAQCREDSRVRVVKLHDDAASKLAGESNEGRAA